MFICPLGRGGWLPNMHHRPHDQHPGGGFPVCITGHMTREGLPPEGSTSKGGRLGRPPPPTTRNRKEGGTHPTGLLSSFANALPVYTKNLHTLLAPLAEHTSVQIRGLSLFLMLFHALQLNWEFHPAE